MKRCIFYWVIFPNKINLLFSILNQELYSFSCQGTLRPEGRHTFLYFIMARFFDLSILQAYTMNTNLIRVFEILNTCLNLIIFFSNELAFFLLLTQVSLLECQFVLVKKIEYVTCLLFLYFLSFNQSYIFVNNKLGVQLNLVEAYRHGCCQLPSIVITIG